MASPSVAHASERVEQHEVPVYERVRVLRWNYRRDSDQLECELSWTRDLTAYELRVYPPRFALTPASELFDDAVSAIERQASLEHALVEDGWHLDQFEHGYL
jgi:hypothetical protein